MTNKEVKIPRRVVCDFVHTPQERPPEEIAELCIHSLQMKQKRKIRIVKPKITT